MFSEILNLNVFKLLYPTIKNWLSHFDLDQNSSENQTIFCRHTLFKVEWTFTPKFNPWTMDVYRLWHSCLQILNTTLLMSKESWML